MRYAAPISFSLAAMVFAGALAFQAELPVMAAQAPPPIVNLNAPNRIPGRYMVIFPAGTPQMVLDGTRTTLMGLGGTILLTYRDPTPGFAVRFQNDTPQLQQALRQINGARIQATRRGKEEAIQYLAPDAYALDRIDQRYLGAAPNQLDQMFGYNATGKDVDIYVVDLGISTSHVEFGGRATPDWSALGTAPADLADCSGHGTFVAGVIAGRIFGVAKRAKLHSVRVEEIYTDENGQLKCGPAEDYVAAAAQWITDDHMMRQTPAVANLSISFGVPQQTAVPDPAVQATLQSIDNMEKNIRDSITAGVTYVVSGGTVGDACNATPSRMNEVIAVGSTYPFFDGDEGLSWGSCIDILAPSNTIVSAAPNNAPVMRPGCSTIATATDAKTQVCLGGTSAAAAEVTGCVARLLQNHASSPAIVRTQLERIANAKGVTGLPDTPGWAGITSQPGHTESIAALRSPGRWTERLQLDVAVQVHSNVVRAMGLEPALRLIAESVL